MKIPFSELNIYEVKKLHKKILKKIKPNKKIFTLNFTDVQKIDFNSIQLILSLKKYCDEIGIELELSHVNSKQIKQTFNLFNLNQILRIA